MKHSPKHLSKQTLTGYLVAAGCVLYLLSLLPGFGGASFLSATCYWFVLFLAWSRLNVRNKKQVSLLIFVGIIAFTGLLILPGEIVWSSLLKGNMGIISMLIAVSTLGLLPSQVKPKPPIAGVKGVLSTWGSVHILGAVINMSSVFLVGDKLQERAKMTPPQLAVIVRALTTAGFWSPFFASMALALSIAPNAQYHNLAMIGIPVALIACSLSLWEFKHRNLLMNFSGFPLARETLTFPLLLAFLVLFFHYFIMPKVAILSIVTLLSPLIAFTALLLQGGIRHAKKRSQDHARYRLPSSANEVSLFLAAGFMTSAIAMLTHNVFGENWSLFAQFGFKEAYLCYLVICFISLLGLHPIVGISLMSSLVPATEANNTLLAFVSISSWGVGTAISPLSAINLSIAGKYEVDNYHLAKGNWFYGALMSLIVAIAMFILSLLLEL